MMSRIIMVLLIIVLIIYFFKRKSLPKDRHESSMSHKNSKATSGEAMVKCKTCGIHLPISEALVRQDKYFCSAAHLPPE